MLIRKIMISLTASIFALIILSSPVSAWDNNITHPNLTNAAVDLLAGTNSSFAFLKDYSGFNLGADRQLTFIDEGSVKEDYALSADWKTTTWGSKQDPGVPHLSWKSHGYNPRTGETWYNIPDSDNALVYSRKIWKAIHRADNRYFQTGRFCHLIEDMASPAHAHGDFHGFGDDLEKYSQSGYSYIKFKPAKVCRPSDDGLPALTGLPHPDLTTETHSNYLQNVAWRTYYMTSYYGGKLVKKAGNRQPDSELKRMFPYRNGGLRYDDGGWFFNDSYVIDDVGNNWIGWGIGINSEWWGCPDDSRYFYLENIGRAVPAVFKTDRFRRVLSTDNLDKVLIPNSRILGKIYCQSLYKLAVEWAAGFIRYSIE